jgi:transcriptional regulator with XRE-family HTH domain
MNTPQMIGAAIRFHHRKAHLSQTKLAQLAGVGKTAVFDIEKGKESIQLDTLTKIFSILNIKLELKSPLIADFLTWHSRNQDEEFEQKITKPTKKSDSCRLPPSSGCSPGLRRTCRRNNNIPLRSLRASVQISLRPNHDQDAIQSAATEEPS